MWLRGRPDRAIAQFADWPLPDSIWICRLQQRRTGDKLMQMSMIITPTHWRLAVHFAYETLPIGGANRRKRTHSMSISTMWLVTYSVSYQMVSQWRPVFPLAEMLLDGSNQKPQARSFTKMSLSGSSLEPITGFLQTLTQNCISQPQKMTRKWRVSQRKWNCTEWPSFTTFGDVAGQPKPTCYPEGISRSK